MTIKQIVENTDTRAGKVFDLAIQAVILISVVSFSIETLPKLSRESQSHLYLVEVVTVGIFTIEYVMRICVSDNRPRFIFSFYGLVDLMAILPFYITAGVDLRIIRAVRLFRVFRVFKTLRYTRAIERFQNAFREIQEDLVLYFLATGLIVFLSSVGIYYFENEAQPQAFGSVFHCLWWSIVTLTTVGYGDAFPVTVGGRIFTGFVLMMGIGIVAVPTGLLASALTATRKRE